jgi:hypothetical protein
VVVIPRGTKHSQAQRGPSPPARGFRTRSGVVSGRYSSSCAMKLRCPFRLISASAPNLDPGGLAAHWGASLMSSLRLVSCSGRQGSCRRHEDAHVAEPLVVGSDLTHHTGGRGALVVTGHSMLGVAMNWPSMFPGSSTPEGMNGTRAGAESSSRFCSSWPTYGRTRHCPCRGGVSECRRRRPGGCSPTSTSGRWLLCARPAFGSGRLAAGRRDR